VKQEGIAKAWATTNPQLEEENSSFNERYKSASIRDRLR
jgi:hypothetical protein